MIFPPETDGDIVSKIGVHDLDCVAGIGMVRSRPEIPPLILGGHRSCHC